jgi:hypothetical protein
MNFITWRFIIYKTYNAFNFQVVHVQNGRRIFNLCSVAFRRSTFIYAFLRSVFILWVFDVAVYDVIPSMSSA